MPTRKPARLVALLLVVLALVGVACGGGGDDEDAEAAPERGDPTAFTIWVPTSLAGEMDRIIRLFKQNQPDIDVEVLVEPALDLNDRLLLGERPDLYVGSARQIDTLIDEGSLPRETVDLGSDVLELVVAPGNPKSIVDLSVFGLDASTTVGLCQPDTICGKGARTVLSNAGVPATPDSTEPNGKTLLSKIAGGSLDAGLLYRSETAKAVREGRVTTVAIPESLGTETQYRIVVVRAGDATDAFLKYVDQSSGVQKVLQNAGLAPVQPAAS